MLFIQILQNNGAARLLLISALTLMLLPSINAHANNMDKNTNKNINETDDTVLSSVSTSCPAWLDESFRKLHSTEQINLCKAFAGKPLFIVNTASHCGFTYQFSGLEALHQRYKDKGLVVIGFASNDFRQAAKSEAKAATICYENYGVSFTMMAPISVSGDNAHPVFKKLAQQTQAPSWNFTKFLVSSDGKKITHFSSSIAPDSPQLLTTIDAML